ncbi:MAG TPA: hypothetical protein PLS65_10880, partial [Ferruginibacter sp.]|nr:hypothetical protein [Ferruginibacter sp.]
TDEKHDEDDEQDAHGPHAGPDGEKITGFAFFLLNNSLHSGCRPATPHGFARCCSAIEISLSTRLFPVL